MTETIRFSVISVVLNHRLGLQKTYDSLMHQIFTNFEWIVIDGGSEDGTLEFLKSLNINYTSEKDQGIYDAMNTGITRASGDYLLFLNAGDSLAGPAVLQTIDLAIKEADSPDFVYGDSYECYGLDALKFKSARAHKHITYGMFTHHQAMFYRRVALGGLRYDLRYSIAADYDLTSRFLSKVGEILYVSLPVCVFEPGGVSQTDSHRGCREQFHSRRVHDAVSLPVNVIVYLVQRGAWWFRRILPGVYWKIKVYLGQ